METYALKVLGTSDLKLLLPNADQEMDTLPDMSDAKIFLTTQFFDLGKCNYQVFLFWCFLRLSLGFVLCR